MKYEEIVGFAPILAMWYGALKDTNCRLEDLGVPILPMLAEVDDGAGCWKEGFYYDPNHGGCLRKIKLSNTGSFLITGAYGSDEPETGKKWTATAKKIGKNEYCIYFSGKKHKFARARGMPYTSHTGARNYHVSCFSSRRLYYIQYCMYEMN